MNARKVAMGLGWFSIGLGITELLAGKQLAKALGVPNRSGLVRFFGAREIIEGLGILTGRRTRVAGQWVWGRVAGDVLDLAALGKTLVGANPNRGFAAFATANVAGITALDAWTAHQLTA